MVRESVKYSKYLRVFKNKTVLITGGTGSFGSYFCRMILDLQPRKLIIFSRDEDKQHSFQHELSGYSKIVKFVIGDVRDKEAVMIATKGGIDILIHAAAMKQIPCIEYNVLEGVKTNILGAHNVVQACLENGIEKALSISTDKACEPVNVYGMTKGIQERIFTLANKYRNGGRTLFASVRYGNVMGSRGSVIPVFKKQIQEGGPVTLTDINMTRFNMTLDETVRLVFGAISGMVGGEVFIPKCATFKIKDLAEAMISELKPKNKKIEVIGIRPGERLHETLISPSESIRAVINKDRFIILPEIRIDEISKKYKFINNKMFRYSSDGQEFLTKKEIKKLLGEEGLL